MLSLKQAVDALNAKHPQSAIGAFNFNDMTDMHGVMYAAAHLRTPCILMASTSCVKYMGIHFAREMFRAAIDSTELRYFQIARTLGASPLRAWRTTRSGTCGICSRSSRCC